MAHRSDPPWRSPNAGSPDCGLLFRRPCRRCRSSPYNRQQAGGQAGEGPSLGTTSTARTRDRELEDPADDVGSAPFVEGEYLAVRPELRWPERRCRPPCDQPMRPVEDAHEVAREALKDEGVALRIHGGAAGPRAGQTPCRRAE